MTPTEITGCSDCPFRENYDGLGQYCHIRLAEVLKLPVAEHDLPENEVDTDDVPKGETPDWCPLRKGPIQIQLKGPTCPDCGGIGYNKGQKIHESLACVMPPFEGGS